MSRGDYSVGDFNFHILVLQAGAWPLSQAAQSQFTVPAELQKCMHHFEAFYNVQYTGRKLSWLHHLCKAEVRVNCLKRRYDLQVTNHQMAVLLLFNDATVCTLEHVRTATGLNEVDLRRALASLTEARVLKLASASATASEHANGGGGGDGDGTGAAGVGGAPGSESAPSGSGGGGNEQAYEINMKFASKRTKIKISTVLQAETQAESAATRTQVDADRKLYVQALVVRVMKARKQLTHTQLMQAVIDQCKSQFSASVPLIKRTIEGLIDKGYMERSEESRDIFRYIA